MVSVFQSTGNAPVGDNSNESNQHRHAIPQVGEMTESRLEQSLNGPQGYASGKIKGGKSVWDSAQRTCVSVLVPKGCLARESRMR